MTDTTGSPQAAAPPAVYRAIASVAGAVAKEGVAKDRRNSQQGYNFRGIDDVYNALAPHLSASGLVILPRVLTRTETERQTQKGGVLFYVVVEVEFDFVAAEDGSRHTVKTYGEAMDSADKATNKAMSAAYKYAAMQAFCIPTDGDNDADATTHSVTPSRQATRNGNGAPPRDDRAIAVATARKQLASLGIKSRQAFEAMMAEIAPPGCATLDQLPASILKRLGTAGPTEAEISRWNAAAMPAAAPLANQEQGEEFDPEDPPIHWEQPTVAGAA